MYSVTHKEGIKVNVYVMSCQSNVIYVLDLASKMVVEKQFPWKSCVCCDVAMKI